MDAKVRSAAQVETELPNIFDFIGFTNKARDVERCIWHEGRSIDDPERNGEHYYQLEMMAWYVIVRFKLDHLNLLLVMHYIRTHDLDETYGGDTPAFPHPDRQHQLMAVDKEKRSREVRKRIGSEWGWRFPELVHHLGRYFLQSDEEARFVYALDKLVADLNVARDGGRTNKVLRVTRSQWEGYKRPKVQRHPLVYQLWLQLCAWYDDHPEYFYPGTGAHVEPTQLELPFLTVVKSGARSTLVAAE